MSIFVRIFMLLKTEYFCLIEAGSPSRSLVGGVRGRKKEGDKEDGMLMKEGLPPSFLWTMSLIWFMNGPSSSFFPTLASWQRI